MTVAVVYHPLWLEHDTGEHPEAAARLEAIMQLLQEVQPPGVEIVCPTAPATVDQVAEVHTEPYIKKVEVLSARGGGQLDLDTAVSSRSYDAALMAAGGAIQAFSRVMDGKASAALALTRPPGHHALAGKGMGFCLFNNVVIAIRHTMKRYGLERVMLVDFDVHHGNGSQDILYDDPCVLYFSTHQSWLFPGTGRIDETGWGEGKGYNVNVPLPGGSGDVAFSQVFRQVLVPVARRFRPELIAVSAGYDIHWLDPLAGLRVSTSGCAAIARTLRDLATELCDGRLAGVLEGGYDLEALSTSVLATLVTWAGGRADDPIGPYQEDFREPDVTAIVNEARRIHGLP